MPKLVSKLLEVAWVSFHCSFTRFATHSPITLLCPAVSSYPEVYSGHDVPADSQLCGAHQTADGGTATEGGLRPGECGSVFNGSVCTVCVHEVVLCYVS